MTFHKMYYRPIRTGSEVNLQLKSVNYLDPGHFFYEVWKSVYNNILESYPLHRAENLKRNKNIVCHVFEKNLKNR